MTDVTRIKIAKKGYISVNLYKETLAIIYWEHYILRLKRQTKKGRDEFDDFNMDSERFDWLYWTNNSWTSQYSYVYDIGIFDVNKCS